MFVMALCLLQLKNLGRGELLVSLCYQPAASRITVVVLKARNLPKMDITGLSGTDHGSKHGRANQASKPE
jgi:hypothetical protein